jgi:chromatin segregation and condensation protein Rec8/ScpA/Scc1 (kleisin family)
VGLTEDFREFLAMEEKRSSFARLRREHLDQYSSISAPRFQPAKKPEDRTLPSLAEELWAKDASRERIHDLALERSIEMERQRGTPEDVIDEVTEAFELWRARVEDSFSP